MQENIINLLLIEDDFFLINNILLEIESPKFSIDWENTYEGGLAAIQTGKYHVCLLDYRLGGKDGIELLKTAKERNCQVPIIFITGQGDRELDLQAIKNGAADYLNKSEIKEQILERVIRYAIERNENLIAFKESQAKLQEVQKIANLGNWEFNLTTQEINCSEQVFEILGINPQTNKLTYPELLKILTPESRKLWEQNLALMLEKTEDCES